MGLVVPGEVEGEGSDQFSGAGVHDVDVEVLDEYQHGGSGVCSSDSQVQEFACEPEAHDVLKPDTATPIFAVESHIALLREGVLCGA